ncbi:MAG: hypothetical protein ACK4RZ_01455 [Paracoccaceae bacterium]
MNGPGREDILVFIERRCGKRLDALDQADVLTALDLDGDKALVFLSDFGNEFNVDLTGYEARMHHHDEAKVLRPGWPITAPYLFGVRLPIAVSTLLTAAQTGRWPMVYPVLTVVTSHQWLNVPLIVVGLPVLVTLLVGAARLI